MANLGVIPGSNNFSRGYAVNDHGSVVGESGNGPSYAFIYKDGVMSNVGSLNASGTGVAYDVNNAGAVVGSSFNGTASKAFLRDESGIHELGTIAGTASATGRASGISENGLVVGVSSNGTVSHATLWRGGPGGEVVDLGALADSRNYSQALAVSDGGLVVGSSVVGTSSPTSSTDLYHAFAWEGGVMTDLGGLASQPTYIHGEARDVNDSGLIVGYVARLYGSPTFGGAAVLWDGGVAFDLNTMVVGADGWNLLSAEGINDRGQIVGYGSFGGQTRAFLLTPNAVPEPSSLAILSVGGLFAASFSLWSRRRGGRS